MITSTLEKKMGCIFKNRALLLQALTHRSYLNERETKLQNNECLEFLGDAVLELIVTTYLFSAFPEDEEGQLTSKRSKIVCMESLTHVAKKLGMENHILLSRGEKKAHESQSSKNLLSDSFEALLGALYLDQGYEEARRFIHRILLSEYEDRLDSIELECFKTRLQELVQEKLKITPTYKDLSESGPDHAKTFTVGVYYDTQLIAQGEGKSKRDAQEQAAKKALEKM